MLLTTQQTTLGQQVSDVHTALQARASRRPQLAPGGVSSCCGSSSSECISQRLLFPTTQLALSDRSGTSSWLGGGGGAVGVFFLVPVYRHSSSQCILQATLAGAAVSLISCMALGSQGLCRNVYKMCRLQAREESGKEQCSGRGWKVLGN